MKRGKTAYIPKCVIEEIEDIKREDDLFSSGEAMRKLIKYARIGRETKRIMKLDWSKKVNLPNFNIKKRRKYNG